MSNDLKTVSQSFKTVPGIGGAASPDNRSKVPAIVQRVLQWRGSAAAISGSGLHNARASVLLGWSFALCVALPAFLVFIYLQFFASDQYVVESRLAVRASQETRIPVMESVTSVTSKLGLPSPGTNLMQNAFIVVNYIKGRSIIDDIGGRPVLEKIFSDPKIDYLSQLERGAKLEVLWKYWNSKVIAGVDTLSGIVTVKVYAFNPQDSLSLSNDIIRASEKLVNDVSTRSQDDAIRSAEQEIERASKKLAAARQELLDFRNRTQIVDPTISATSVSDMIATLMTERIDLENNISTFAGTLSKDSSAQRVQRARIAALDEQIKGLQNQLTDTQSNKTLSASMTEYQQLKLNEMFAEKLYTIAQSSYERARQDRNAQSLYLSVIVRPSLPESSLYPRVFLTTLFSFGLLTIAWGIVSIIVASIKDHMI